MSVIFCTQPRKAQTLKILAGVAIGLVFMYEIVIQIVISNRPFFFFDHGINFVVMSLPPALILVGAHKNFTARYRSTLTYKVACGTCTHRDSWPDPEMPLPKKLLAPFHNRLSASFRW